MPRSNNDQLPATYVASGAWPYARLVEDAPVSAYYGQAFARNLAEAMEVSTIGLRALGDKAGVSHATISRLLRGMVLPDLGTLARLEVALGVGLWPGLTAWTEREHV
ncbi:helix-turn-helix domain-containing protein [Streptomyces sp. NPDC002643]|uniref:helix-turn-helix domain-containing protein n=1 Tax=Streptomyces sp. T028 TaxID=3394379 RepID=UPI003A88C523